MPKDHRQQEYRLTPEKVIFILRIKSRLIDCFASKDQYNAMLCKSCAIPNICREYTDEVNGATNSRDVTGVKV